MTMKTRNLCVAVAAAALCVATATSPSRAAILTHRWSFNGDLNDSVGGVNATIKHQTANTTTVDGGTGVNIEDGKAVLSGGAGAGFLNLGTGVLGTGNAATIEVWARREGNFNAWHYAISYHKPDVGKCYTICSGRHSDVRRSNVAMTDSTGGGDDKLVGHPIGVTYHYSVTFTSSAVRTMVRNAETGALIVENTCVPSSWSLASAAADGWALTLGDNPWANSTLVANYSFDEARVWDGVLSDEQLTANALAGPDSVVGGGESGIVVAAGNTFTVDGPGGYGFYTSGAVTLETGAKIRFDTASWTNFPNRVAMRFKAGSFALPSGASSVLDFVELSDSTHYTASLEDATTIKVALNSSIPATSTWNGGTPTAESLALASSWTSVDADGNAISAAPGCGTTVVIPAGSTTFTIPTGYTPEWGRVIFGAAHPATQCGWINSTPDAAKVEYIDKSLSAYALFGEKAITELNASGSDNQSGNFVKDYLEDSQVRFDGWFYVTSAQAGKWTIDCHFDDLFALLIDGERVLQDPRWDPAIKAGAFVSEGWHRFTLVGGDTGGGYGSGDFSNHPMRIYINGASSYVYFDGFTSGSGSSTITLAADCDWSALGELSLDSGAVIDLNGHDLIIDDMTSGYLGAAITNSSSSRVSTIYFPGDPYSSTVYSLGVIKQVGERINLMQNGSRTATWTGAGDDGDISNAANWSLKVGAETAPDTLPTAQYLVQIAGTNVNMQVPSGTTLNCAAIQIQNCTFTADCDWRGLSKTPAIVATADLNGHNLRLNALTALAGGAFANSSETESQVRFPVNVVDGAITDNGLISNSENLSVASNVRILMVNEDYISTSSNPLIGYLSGGTVGFVQAGNASSGLGASGKALELGKASGGTGLFRVEAGEVVFTGISAQSVAGADALIELAGGKLQTQWLDLGRNSSGSAIVNQTGGTFVGTGAIWIGRESGGTGVYNLTGGIFGSGFSLGQVSGSTGRMTVGGAGVVNLTRGSAVGAEGVGYLTITNGGMVTATDFIVGGNNSSKSGNSAGTVTLTGGALNVTNTALIVGQYKTGTLDIGGDGVVNAPVGVKLGNQSAGDGTLVLRESGVLNTPKIEKGSGVAAVTFDGGTLVAKNAASGVLIDGVDTLTFGDGGTIDTDGNNVSVSSTSVAGPTYGGSFTKAGAGTLTLDALPPVAAVNVTGGTLVVPGGDNTASSTTNTLAHRWSFNGDYNDSVGNITATQLGNAMPPIVNDEVVMPGGAGAGSLCLGTGTLGSGEATIEIWATQTELMYWHYIFGYGVNEGSDMLAWAWRNGANNYDNASLGCASVEGFQGFWSNTITGLADVGTEYHFAITFTDNGDDTTTIKFSRRNPTNVAEVVSRTFTVANWNLALGASTWELTIGYNPFDNSTMDAAARYNEVRVWHSALSDTVLAVSALYGPDATAAQIASLSNAASGRILNVASGARVSLQSGALTQPVVAGSGTISGGRVNVTTAISPGGDGTVGTLTLSGGTVTGEIRLDVGDKIVVNGGTLDISGATVTLLDPANIGEFVFIECVNGGSVTGMPTVDTATIQSPWKVQVSGSRAKIGKSGIAIFLR